MQVNVPAPTEEDIRAIVAPLASLEGPLLPMLHALQDSYGHVPQVAVPVLADVLNLGRAEVHGVISFYHDFRDAPAGRHVLRICRAEACQSMGSNTLAESTLSKLGIGWHDTTQNGAVTIEPVYCLGLCACAPAAMLDDRVVGRVDDARMDKLLSEAGA
ncbi:formate dehydrogenase subunit gamma [Paracoccus saliphilus]|uniref:Formate dehydrogenase gamma subunit n=1 Tax=Paracoccus saliphilus TaxID=405559 RepID=A0AA45W8F4_9RHOB|nr:formate dehydrogenase subunit gamma [Paracoccus saliphilus]WCR02078.1 formate dehydrogenase subunit gamma [Paracoccus saliphilus]SIT16751.1 formate dehydrogenase gamma subunit [Paracoccus saliphilus]